MKKQLKVGDVVAIRGDLRTIDNGYWETGEYHSRKKCAYTPDQLIDGKYLKHTGHGGMWTGVVKSVNHDRALVGGGWRHHDYYEVICQSKM